MNTNLIHNILNIAIAVVAALGAFDWTVLFSQTTALAILAGLGTTKSVMNMLRDGFAGLFKQQPPVQ